MKGLQKTFLILAVLTLSVQSVRHFYIKYIETTASVLDKFDEKDVEEEIEKADSLDELVAKYTPLRERKDQLDAIMEEEEKGKPEKERYDFRREFRREHKKEYEKTRKLRSAISDWEARSKEIRELRIFWAFGFGLFILGCIVYLKRQWLGMAFLIPGVIEMIWWTSPSFRMGGTVKEFERLLNNKLLFTGITFALVVMLWLVYAYIHGKSKNEGTL